LDTNIRSRAVRQCEVVCPDGDADRSKPRSRRRSPRLAEALTNVAKHADARGASVCAPGADGTLRLAVRDDGVGGAQLDGSGLVGLADRLSVLGGRLAIDSPRGGPTVIAGDIPLAGP
jgi:glucose-6-phosphate-specific signal transduction histidine kinase